MKSAIAAATISTIGAGAVFAQDFDVGLRAYESGDHAAALKQFEPLAEKGDAAAQHVLGMMYDSGQGMPQDHEQAMRLYRLAAEQGHASAQFDLGVNYRIGRAVKQDYSEAVRWYRRAAEQGHASAQENLGGMYFKGMGILQDYVSAHMWLNIAAAAGDETAGKNRDKIASNMTPQQLSEAQSRARVCLETNYQDCD